MNKLVRLLLVPMCLLALMVAYPARAQLTTIYCNTAVHVSDFTACAKGQDAGNLGHRWYVGFSATGQTAVSITVIQVPKTGVYAWTVTAVQPNGSPVTSDAGLGVVDSTLITTIVAAKGISPINLDPQQTFSLLDVPDPLLLTQEIDNALLSMLGVGYVYVTPLLTTVLVTATGDGTNAQFVRISMTGSVQWEMKPGTLKNKAGQFIDSSGNVIGPPVNHLSAPGFVPGLPNFPGIGLTGVDWGWWSSLPKGKITVGDLCIPDSPC